MPRRRDLDVVALATAMNVPRPTVVMWLRLWDAMGVEGIRREPSRGRYGYRYVVTASLLAAWRRGELPAPRSNERFAAALSVADAVADRFTAAASHAA